MPEVLKVEHFVRKFLKSGVRKLVKISVSFLQPFRSRDVISSLKIEWIKKDLNPNFAEAPDSMAIVQDGTKGLNRFIQFYFVTKFHHIVVAQKALEILKKGIISLHNSSLSIIVSRNILLRNRVAIPRLALLDVLQSPLI